MGEMNLPQALKIIFLLSIAMFPFLGQTQDFTYTTNNDNTITITGYVGSGGAVNIPSAIESMPVTKIGTNAFFEAFTITSVTIPPSITSIGDRAFLYCPTAAIYFQGNAPDLGINVFGANHFNFGSTPPIFFAYPNCYYLQDTAGWNAYFGNCQTFLLSAPFTFILSNNTFAVASYAGSDSTIIIPSTINGLPITAIQSNVFSGVAALNIIIPDSITSIGDNAFSGSDLVSVTIPNSVTTIGADAFEGCENLTNLIFPNSGAMDIGDWAFLHCANLVNVTIPNSVTSIGYYSFGQCTALTNIMISSSAISIGELAFVGCTNLASVYCTGNAPGADFSAFIGDNAIVYYLPGTTGWSSALGGIPTALWWLPYPLILENNANGFGVRCDGFGFVISWATNNNVIVEARANLADSNWCPISTNVLTGGSCYFNDTQWTNYPTRFYRLRSE